MPRGDQGWFRENTQRKDILTDFLELLIPMLIRKGSSDITMGNI
jgi:hypothetical protein